MERGCVARQNPANRISIGMKILIFNAGSSTLKFSLMEADRERTLAEGVIECAPASSCTHADSVARILDRLQSGASAPLRALAEIRAVGHRVVHGGDRYATAVRITAQVRRDIEALAELAPLHNAVAAQVMDATEAALPGVPQVAVFDTAFHATLPEAARTYPVPKRWTNEWGIRRYGFHGLSHAYCARRAAQMLRREDARVIIAHLGNGASVSAVRGGVCVDTSMGFTPLEGLMMGTRSGSVDPGILIYLMRKRGLNAEQLDHALNHESGLLGVSGVSSDMREVLDARERKPAARLAVDLYVHRVRQTIGAMAASLGGVDALVFTAGIGKHSPEIRRLVCAGLGYMGLELDPDANANRSPDADVAADASPARVLIIATREDLTIVRETLRLLSPRG